MYYKAFVSCVEEFLIQFTRMRKRFNVLTLKRRGGGGGDMMAPPRHIARLLGNARSSRRDTLWQFSLEYSAHFDTKFVTVGGTVPKLRNIVYMHVGPYKINANWVFSLSSYKYAYFHSQLLKSISFWFIVLQKVSATNFGEKTTKTKGRKNKEIHKKFTKQ